ncbi:MAG TPA: archease [Methanoregula sp.]|nr:archease [Methanoregula sp.]
MSFEELPHTADIKIRARAPTLNALFSDVLDALMQVMYGPERSGGIDRRVDLSSADTESLLAEFLSEVLFVSEVDGLVFKTADIAIEGLHVSAVLHGEPFDFKKHAGGTEVKGISYTGLSIEKEANGYKVDIVFDV